MKLLYADAEGVLYEDPELQAAAWTGAEIVPFPGPQAAIPLPPGSDLVLLPERAPVGWAGKPVPDVKRLPGGERLFAAAALLPAGFTRTLLPAYRVHPAPNQADNVVHHQLDDVARLGAGSDLGLFGYTAVAAHDGELFVAAAHTDEEYRWNPLLYNDRTLPRRIKLKRREFPRNRLVNHLAHCATTYRCLTAQNIFYSRWEAGIPVSPGCNADCLGCISLQASGCCPAPQARIEFLPSVAEVTELGAAHLAYGIEPIVSFGQGCEGEPLLQSPLLAAAIGAIRQVSDRGAINLNTNGSDPEALDALARAGLDSVRVSLISARKEIYAAYHRPRGFGLADVRRTLAVARARGLFVSLNLLVFPGLTDRAEELEALLELVHSEKVDLIQLRNLNFDPHRLFKILPPARGRITGVENLIAQLRAVPGIRVGSFTSQVEKHHPSLPTS